MKPAEQVDELGMPEDGKTAGYWLSDGQQGECQPGYEVGNLIKVEGWDRTNSRSAEKTTPHLDLLGE